jgi:hypothetical protein
MCCVERKHWVNNMLSHRLGHIVFTRHAIGVLAVGMTVLTGCAYEYVPLRVDVRERTSHEPVIGAEVTISNTHTINPKPPEPATGVTGEDGSVTLDVAIYNSLVIRIIPPGEPEHVFSAELPSLVDDPSGWYNSLQHPRNTALPPDLIGTARWVGPEQRTGRTVLHPSLVDPLRWFGPVRTKGAKPPTIEIRLGSPLAQLPEEE